MKSSLARLFLTWRVLLFLPLYAGFLFIPYRAGQEFTRIWYWAGVFKPVSSILLYPWANFDGIHYLNIAGNGYTANARFFPLFPLLAGFISRMIGAQKAFDWIYFFSSLILSNLFFLISLWILYALVRKDYSKSVAQWTIVFLLLFPTSFFFISIYSESLFLLLSLLCFYFARKKQWILSSFCASLLVLTRFVGICILPALIYEFVKYEKNRRFKKAYVLLFPILTFVGYLLFNYVKWGNALYFLQAQGELSNGRSTTSLILFPQTMFRYMKIFITVSPRIYEWWIALVEFISFLFASSMLYIAWKKNIRFSYILYSAFCILIPASSGTFSGMPRYIAILFPIYIAVAMEGNKAMKILYGIVSGILLFILLMVFSRGYYVS